MTRRAYFMYHDSPTSDAPRFLIFLTALFGAWAGIMVFCEGVAVIQILNGDAWSAAGMASCAVIASGPIFAAWLYFDDRDRDLLVPKWILVIWMVGIITGLAVHGAVVLYRMWSIPGNPLS